MWVTENGTCPMTNANVTISDIQEAEPQYLKTLHAFRESGGDSPTSSGGGGGGGAAAAPSAPAPCGACHPCGSHGGSGARADGGDGGGAKPFRVKPCIHGASCRHLKRNGHPENACTFLHEPEHLYPQNFPGKGYGGKGYGGGGAGGRGGGRY